MSEKNIGNRNETAELGIPEVIRTRLLGVDPDVQDIRFDDADWQRVLDVFEQLRYAGMLLEVVAEDAKLRDDSTEWALTSVMVENIARLLGVQVKRNKLDVGTAIAIAAVSHLVDLCDVNETEFTGWGDGVIPPEATALTLRAKAAKAALEGDTGETYRCDVSVIGRVDGMDNLDPIGSYVKLAILAKNGMPRAITIPVTAAEPLAAELVGAASTNAPKGLAEDGQPVTVR